MEITINGTAKEIADLVSQLQDRQLAQDMQTGEVSLNEAPVTLEPGMLLEFKRG